MLGPPRAMRDGEMITKLRTQKVWGILASLALEPGTDTRAALARRFWPEANWPGQSLSMALNAMRSALGEDILVEDAGTLRLNPDCLSDVQEMREAMQRARRLNDANNAAEKAAILREAALWIRGPFLKGFEKIEASGWVDRQREALRRETIALLQDLMAACRATGDEAGVMDAAQRLLMIDPEDAAAQSLLLQSRRPSARNLNLTMEWAIADATLANMQERSAPFSFSDALTLESLIEKRLATLPAALRRSLQQLSVFPDSFTAAQAEGVSGVVSAEIARFVETQFLHPVSPIHEAALADGLRYALRGAVRETLWRRLTGEERRRLAERHARFIAAATIARGAEPPDIFLQKVQGHRDWVERESANLNATLNWFLSRPPEADAILMFAYLWDICRLMTSQDRDWLVEPAFDYLTAYIESETARPEIVTRAMETLFWIATNRHDAGEALQWLEQYMARRAMSGVHPPEYYFMQLLIGLHHAGDDAGFDRIAEPALAWNSERSAEWGVRVHHLIAENYYARRRLEEALAHNDHCVAYWRAHNNAPFLLTALYQRGCIMRGLERTNEARALFNEAMEGFEAIHDQHEVASCLNSLAGLCRESGTLSEARRHAQGAIALFGQVGDVAAVHVASATLGDILRDRGDFGGARALYEPGLAFWREKGHPRWTAIFEEKIARLSDRGGKESL